jgi:hypothetical protein
MRSYLFIDPSGFDRGGERPDGGVGGQSKRSIYVLRSTVAPREADLLAGHALDTVIKHPLPMAIRNPNTGGCEETGQPALGTQLPTDLSPFLIDQHRLSGDRWYVGDVMFVTILSLRDGENWGNIGRIQQLTGAGDNAGVNFTSRWPS